MEVINVPSKHEMEYQRLTAQALADDEAILAAQEPPETRLTVEQKVESLRNATAGYLYGVASQVVGQAFDVFAWQAYLERFLQDAGNPTDPIERLLLEQVLLAHHALGRVHVTAGTTADVEAVKACLPAIARLLGEVRRTALALKAYRQSSPVRVPDAALDVEEPAGADREPEPEKTLVGSGLGSNATAGHGRLDPFLNGHNGRNGHHEHAPA
jgi:hypothetical protein